MVFTNEYSTWPIKDGGSASGLSGSVQGQGAHVTFAAGSWGDYGITVVDDTATFGADDPFGPTWYTRNPLPGANGSSTGSLVHSVPGDFLSGPGAGPPAGDSQSPDQDG